MDAESHERGRVSGGDPGGLDWDGGGEVHDYDLLGPADRQPSKHYDVPVFARESSGPAEHVYENTAT